ncbi:MAG: TlpA family protein disulfide reductase [Burkholderiaceae bacterium]|nr:TlpA family protein disulfide reductase [Burkholderiaceae bacterium]
MAAFWALRLPAVVPASGDGEVALAAFRGRPLLVNFWATWCPPCVTEMPLLSFFYAQRGVHDWQCLGLAVEDKRAPVVRFLARAPVSYPIALAGLAGVQLSRGLGNTQGGLPFTLLFDANGQVKYRKTGQLQPSDLSAWLG